MLEDVATYLIIAPVVATLALVAAAAIWLAASRPVRIPVPTVDERTRRR